MQTRVLLITGGHDYEREPFLALWRSVPGIQLLEAQYPDAEAFFTGEKSGSYDVLAFYDFGQRMSAAAHANFLNLTQRGKGLIFLHHALLGHVDWPEYLRIVGGAWIDGERTIDGKRYTQSQYAPGQRVSVQVVPHAITRGLQDFEMIDETYANLYVEPDNSALLTTTHSKSDRMLGWTRRYENSRIVYLQPGHGPSAYENANYRELVRRSIAWVDNKLE